MKILLVNKFHYRKGGSETYYFDLAEGLRKLGHEVVFFAMQGPENEPCEQEKYFVSASDYSGNTSAFAKAKAALSITYNKEAKERFEKLLQAEKPDVIHLNLTHKQITFSILDAPSAKGIPVVFTSHDYIMVCPNYLMLDGDGNVCDRCLDGNFKHCLDNKCIGGSIAKSALAMHEANYLKKHHVYSKLDRIIAPSEFMRSKLIEGGRPSDQVVVMQNFAPDDLIMRAKSGSRAGRERSLLFFGRLSKEKGIDVLVQAFIRIANELPDWRLIIAGDGPERENIEDLVSQSGLDGRIELTGRLDKNQMQKYVERASLSIASSRWRENMPYSIVESLAAGTPVIGSNIGGIPELVIPGETGFLCEPDNADSLASAIKQAVSMDEESYSRMQQNCQNYVIERCGQSQYMEKLLALYEQLIAEKRRG